MVLNVSTVPGPNIIYLVAVSSLNAVVRDPGVNDVVTIDWNDSWQGNAAFGLQDPSCFDLQKTQETSSLYRMYSLTN
jgi:hypothetical protein